MSDSISRECPSLTVQLPPYGHATGTAWWRRGMMMPVKLIVPPDEVALIEVAKVKRGARSDWRGALEEPSAIWDGGAVADALKLIEQLPESELMRCFSPGFGIRLHDESAARAEVLFCFKCHMALMIDLLDPHRRDAGATFDPESEPARELLSRFRSCTAEPANQG